LGAGIGFGYAIQAVSIAAAWLVGTRVLGLARPALGALLIAAAFGNTGFLGLPFSAALFGLDELPNAIAYDVVVSGIGMVTVGFSLGAAFGTIAERPRDRAVAFFTRNPPLWACLAAIAAPDALAPGWAVDASRVLVFAILPLGFVAVGVTLARAGGGVGLFAALDPAVSCALVIKLLVAPGLMVALSVTLVSVPDSYVSQAGMATAITSILVANEYGLDRRLAAAAIAWSTALVVIAGLVAAAL
jgi:hypothetical protein